MKKPKKSTKLWLARDNNSRLYLYNSKPKRSKDFAVWNCKDFMAELDGELFPDVKWEDEEPTQVTLRI